MLLSQENIPHPTLPGPIVCTLTWEIDCDLAIHCKRPTGAIICWTNMNADGGQHDFDMVTNRNGPPVENIFWRYYLT